MPQGLQTQNCASKMLQSLELGNLELLPLQMKHTKMERVPDAGQKIFGSANSEVDRNKYMYTNAR